MYPNHWGLRGSPFAGLADRHRFTPTAVQEEALARLLFLVDNQRRLGLLAAPHGSGKTLLLTVLADQLARQGARVAGVNLCGLDDRELLWSLAAELGAGPTLDAPLFVLWRLVTDKLHEHKCEQLATVLLLDDLDRASSACLASLLRLVRLDPTSDARLTIVLSVDAARLPRVPAELLADADLRIDLDPWDANETEQYVARSLAAAGAPAAIFSPAAAQRLCELSAGVPKRINRLADLALLAGASLEIDQIDADVVDAVHEELAVE